MSNTALTLTKAFTVSTGLLLSACAAPVINDASLTGGADLIFQDGKPAVEFGIDFEIDFTKDKALKGATDDVPPVSVDTNPAKPILDLIGFTEGTDRGDGYNETLAYGAFTNGDVVLTEMTLAEIEALQTEMLRHPDNSWNSSAIGRYQIVRTTLNTLKQNLDLGDDRLFNAELQDRLAVELLRGRGYNDWTEGRMSNERFALNLSKEWASLPNPHTGVGFYPGQHAAVSYAEVEMVFDEVR